MDTKEYGKMVKRILILEEGRVPAKNTRGWTIEGQKKGCQGRNTKDCGRNLRLEASWHTRACWKIHWLRQDLEREKAGMDRLKEEAQQENSKSGKRELEGEWRRVQSNRRCLDRVLGEVFKDFCPTAEVESVGISFGLSVCVPDVPLAVPDATVLFLFCEGDCAVLYDSDCHFVEPRTLALSGKREAFFSGNQEHTNFDGTLAKAPSASRRRIVSPTPQQSPQPSLGYAAAKWRWRTRNLALVQKKLRVTIGGRPATERLLQRWTSTCTRVTT